MRLQKFLAGAGLASRRQCENLIAAGRVKVNGQVVTEMGVQIDPAAHRVEVDGRPVKLQSYIYVLMNKPSGYITTARDTHGRPTVMDLLPPLQERVFPVGRLDADTTGVLLFTNDGPLAHRLTHPRFGVTKTYRALVKGQPSPETIARMRKGVKLADGITAPAGIRILGLQKGTAMLELKLREGRKREVKRLCAAVGHPVIALERTSFAFLGLKGLPRGVSRLLTPEEIRRLQRI